MTIVVRYRNSIRVRCTLGALHGRGGTMAKNNATVDRVQAVWNKLGGEEGVDRLLRDELKIVEVHPREFTIWKTIKIGICKTSDEYCAVLRVNGQKIGKWGRYILDEISYSQKETCLDLVTLSAADLGFKSDTTNADVFRKAVEVGLELCPAEVGPALRLQYVAQPRGERLVIAMKSVVAVPDNLNIFELAHENGYWLEAGFGHSGYVRDLNTRYVFVRRK